MKTVRNTTLVCFFFITLSLLNISLLVKAQVTGPGKIRMDGYYYAVFENNTSYIIFYENGLTFGNPRSRSPIEGNNRRPADIEKVISNKIIYLSNAVYNVSENNFDKYSYKNDTIIVSRIGGRAGDKTLTEYYFTVDNPESLSLVKEVHSGSKIRTENKTESHNVTYKFVKLDIKLRTASVTCNYKKKDKIEPVVNNSDAIGVDGYYYAVTENRARLLVFYREGVCYGDMEQYVPLPDSAQTTEKIENFLNDYLIHVFRQTASYPHSYKYEAKYSVNNDSLVIEKYKSERNKRFFKYYGSIENPQSFTITRQEYICDKSNKETVESALKFKFVKFNVKPHVSMPKK